MNIGLGGTMHKSHVYNVLYFLYVVVSEEQLSTPLVSQGRSFRQHLPALFNQPRLFVLQETLCRWTRCFQCGLRP